MSATYTSARVGRARRWWPLLLMALVAATTIPTQPAQAHGGFVKACPAPGEVMSVLGTIELEFADPIDEAADPAPALALASNNGRTDLEIGPTVVEGSVSMVATIGVEPEAGVYTVRYLGRSADGTLVDGGYRFTYDPEAQQPTNCLVEADPASGGAGLALAVGTTLLVMLGIALWIRTRRPASVGD